MFKLFILVAAALTLVLGAGCGSKQKQDTVKAGKSTARTGMGGTDSKHGTATTTAVNEKGEPTVSFDPIYFDFDSDALRPEARDQLAAIAQHLERSPSEQLTIEGHADEQGTAEYNIALGERRAQAIQKYLVRLGIKEGRLRIISYGEERPAATGKDEDAYSKNRRGSFVRD